MAKKKTLLSGSKALLIVAGGGIATVTILLLVAPLYIPDFPIDVYGISEQILVQFNGSFEPDELTVQEQEENAMINIMINEQLNEECQFEAEGEVISDIDPCQDETQQDLDEIGEMINEPDPSPPNMTSTDPPPEQLCDIDPTNPLCVILPPPALVNLITSITKIDSLGNMEFVADQFGFTPLAFFVEDLSDADFRTGFIETGLIIQGEPEASFTGSGEYDIRIDNQTIFTSPIQLTLSGTGDMDGNILLEFIGPGGIPSTIFNFAFEDHFDKFANEEVTDIKFFVDNVQVTMNGDSFSLLEQEIFSMGIARDDIQLIIIDQNTNETSRVFPMDSRIIVSSSTFTPSAPYCKIGHACENNRVRCCLSGSICTVGVKTGTYPTSCFPSGSPYERTGTDRGPTFTAKPLTGFTLLDQEGRLITTGTGGSSGIVFDYNQLTRNENYTLVIASPSLMTELSYGKNQETQSYTCKPTSSTTYTVTSSRVCNTCGQGPSCSDPCSWTTSWYLRPSFTERSLQCDLP